jgi:diacylglycerol O-acyltransferase
MTAPAAAPASRRLSAHDASFLYTETPTGPMHGASVGIFEGEMPFEAVVETIESRLHLVPRYRQRLAFVPFNMHHPTWEDDPDFDLSNHVVRHVMPAGTTLEAGIRKAVELSEPMLDRDRPMWKTVLLEGVRERTLLLSMVHHCMIDGVSGVELSTILMDFEPHAPPPAPPASPWIPAPFPDEQALIASAARDLAKERLIGMFEASALMLDPARAAQRSLQMARAGAATSGTPDRPVVMAPWNAAPLTRRRTLEWRKYPFALMRQLRTAHGGTVNDIALTVISEAVARWLQEQGYDLRGRYLRLMVPVNMRREGEMGEMGNRVSGLFPTLPAWPMTAKERHAAVSQEMLRRKASGEAQAMELMMEAASSSPPSSMAAMVWQANAPDPGLDRFAQPPPRLPVLPPLPAGFNFTVSNVPGVQVPQFMAGHRMLDAVGTIMLGGNLGFGAVVTSYNQALYFNLAAEPRLMPGLGRVAELLEDVVGELAADAGMAAEAAQPLPVGASAAEHAASMASAIATPPPLAPRASAAKGQKAGKSTVKARGGR